MWMTHVCYNMFFFLFKVVFTMLKLKACAKCRISSPSSFLLPKPNPPSTLSNPSFFPPTCPFYTAPMKHFSLRITDLTRSSKCSKNLSFSNILQPFCGAYAETILTTATSLPLPVIDYVFQAAILKLIGVSSSFFTALKTGCCASPTWYTLALFFSPINRIFHV